MPSKSNWLPIFLSCLVLMSINLLMINSMAPQLFFKQLISWVVGLIAFFVGKQLNPKYFSQLKWPLFIASCVLLILPIIQNTIVRGSSRWLYLGPLSIQPAEMVKPLLMLFLSHSSLPLLHLIPVLIIMLQPDLGSAITVFALIIPVILYNKKLLFFSAIALGVAVIASPLIWNFGLHDYQKERIHTFINPNSDPLGKGYNVIQSQIAIGSGGFWGRGYRQGTQGQLLFLPEKHSDFIFAATAEELGFVGIAIILICYYFLLSRLISKAYSTENKAQFLFTLGIVFQVWIQLFINIGMNLGLMPVTGIPLPFVSVGGSSVISLLFSLGIIFAI